MKISKETTSMLKNYASINGNMLFTGNVLKTTSVNKTIVSTVTVSEQFPQEFGVYDLNEFLGTIALFQEPELDFQSKFVTISEGNNKIKYFAADPSILTAPKKDITFPAADIEFNLTNLMIGTIHRAAGVLKASDFSVIGDGTSLTITIGDKKNPTSNNYETVVGVTSKVFRANIKIDNLKMLQSDYKVTIHPKIARFQSTVGDLVYYVAVEADSSF